MSLPISTIVEITEAYQPRVGQRGEDAKSTIVEIIEAYQPSIHLTSVSSISTIVEIIEAYQPFCHNCIFFNDIYNSRNYRSLLAKSPARQTNTISTIVEIIEAYQPVIVVWNRDIYLQQQKLQKLTSLGQGEPTA